MAKRNTGADQGTVRNYFPAYRVFIEGIEVTELCAAVRVQWPTQSPSQCTIELANPSQLMTITREDMLTIAQLRSGTVDRFIQIQQAQAKVGSFLQTTDTQLSGEFGSIFTPAELAAFRASTGARTDQFVLTPDDILRGIAKDRQGTGFFRTAVAIDPVTPDLANIKNELLPRKLDVATYTQSTTGVDGSPLPGEVFFKYPFVQGKWIWHHSDRVRVAFRHPSDPTIWYWQHAGTLTDISESETEDQMSTLTLVSEGLLKDLRNARLVNMTGSYLSPKIFKGPAGEVSTFSDDQLSPILSTVPFSNFLQNLTLFQIVEVMIYGVQSVLADLGQAVRENQDPAVIAERFGIPVDTSKGTVSVSEIKAREQQLRGLNLSGLSKFKKWKSGQGVEVRILGGPITAGDTAIGEQVKTLAEWHALLDNQVSRFDVVTMSDVAVDDAGGPTVNTGGRRLPPDLKGIRATQIKRASSMTIDEVITQIGSNPDTYPIRQRVRMLLPASLGSKLGRKVLELDLAGCPASQAEFFDRLSLLQQVIDRIDFCLYDTPRGDVVIEMPLYDFEPRHFTTDGGLALLTEQIAESRTTLASIRAFLEAAITVQGDEQQFFTDQQFYTVGLSTELLTGEFVSSVPDYDTVFSIFSFEQLRLDLSSSEQDIKTAWISVPRFLNNVKGDVAATARRRVQTFLPNLVPLYGIRVEQGDPPGQIQTEEAARVYNHIQLNKANADATNVRVPCLPNWQAWPNRPVFIESRAIISTTKSVSHAIVWQSDCSTEYGLWHSKFWDGRFVSEREGTVQRPLYVPFGGVNAQPYNFAYLLGIDKVQKALNVKQSQADVQAALAQARGKK